MTELDPVDPSSVNVPRFLVDRLLNELEPPGGRAVLMSCVYAAARNLVDAAQRPDDSWRGTDGQGNYFDIPAEIVPEHLVQDLAKNLSLTDEPAPAPVPVSDESAPSPSTREARPCNCPPGTFITHTCQATREPVPTPVELTAEELEWLTSLVGVGMTAHPTSKAAQGLRAILAARLSASTDREDT